MYAISRCNKTFQALSQVRFSVYIDACNLLNLLCATLAVVKVVDINQGETPMRVLSLRVLPQTKDEEEAFHPEEEDEDAKVGRRVNM